MRNEYITLYKKRGMNVVFIAGNIGLEGGGYARGAHRGNVMYINIADGDATAEQIAAHEYFHDFLDRYAQTGAKAFKKSADEVRSWAIQQLVEKIRKDYNDGIDELMSVYAETYFTDEDGNITVSADLYLRGNTLRRRGGYRHSRRKKSGDAESAALR